MSDMKHTEYGSIIGTCSACGGAVVSGRPARCRDCGAQAKNPYGPVVETVPQPDSPKLLLETKQGT